MPARYPRLVNAQRVRVPLSNAQRRQFKAHQSLIVSINYPRYTRAWATLRVKVPGYTVRAKESRSH